VSIRSDIGAHRARKLTCAARINSRLLDKYRGQTVRLTAQVKSVSGDTAQVEAADGGTVSVRYWRSVWPSA